MAIKQRCKMADYLDISNSGSPKYELMGVGFTELNEEPQAQTSEKQYVNDVSKSKNITGYNWQKPFETDEILSNEVIEYITDIGRYMKIGAETETTHVMVDLDSPIHDSSTTFKARQIKVCVQVDSFGNNDGEVTCSGTLLGQGGIVAGQFDTSSKTFTADGE